MRISGVVFTILFALAAWPVTAQDMSWTSQVRADGWPSPARTADGDMLIFRRPAAEGPEGRPRLELRYEYRDGTVVGGKRYLTMLSLDEYDCKSGRLRNLRLGVFARHNAEGDSLVAPPSVDPWTTPQEGTVDAKSLAVACAR